MTPTSAVTSIRSLARVAGEVTEVLVDDNRSVKAGQVLAQDRPAGV